MEISHDLFAISESLRLSSEVTHISTDRHALLKLPLQFLRCDGLRGRESAHAPKTSTASHCLPAAAKGDATLPRYIHPQRSLFFLYLSLEFFLKTIRHHGRPSSYVKFVENNTGQKCEVPSDPANHFSKYSQTSMDNSYHIKVNLSDISKHKGLLCISNCKSELI